MSTDPTGDAPPFDAKAAAQLGALNYLMLMVLQRLDAAGHLSLAELTQSVLADRGAVPPGTDQAAAVQRIFDATLELLQRAAAGIAPR